MNPSRIIDTFFREPKLIWKYYRPFLWLKKKNKGLYVFCADGKFLHGGMFDRLKGIISIYALAKAQGKELNFFLCILSYSKTTCYPIHTTGV